MDKKLAKKLESVMNAVPVCEGLIYCELDGEVIIGQTITEMDHSAIAKKMVDILESDLSAANKGDIKDASIELEEGALVGVLGDDNFVIGILGDDGLSSKGLLRKQLQNLMNSE